uniref:NADH-ubiquinone oxidoreductase chain 2 n=1 Tax=Bregmaceros nectabanus TaxID=181412 RepID=Q8HMA2_BRENE|nr:NADH dehydrogenase subunit 2 [Bregmaceros nectabanus]
MPAISILFFITSLILGTAMTLSSNHWFMAWMGLEISTLAIIPLMTMHHHPRAIEAATKYFITQAAAAAIILFASLINALMTSQWDIYFDLRPFPAALLILALALKLGIAPVHVWFPEVLQGLNLTTGLILATWQKLAPFILLLQIMPSSPLLMILLGLMSILVGGWGGINQTQLRKVLAYSSIAHVGWIILVIQLNQTLSLLALMLYIPMTMTVFLMLMYNSTHSYNSLAISWSKSSMILVMAPFAFLSLAGLPPLSGFLPKWLIMEELTKQDIPMIALVAAISSLLSLYFYIHLLYTLSVMMAPNLAHGGMAWRLYPLKSPLPIAIAFVLSTLAIPFSPLIYSLLPI